MLQAFDSKTTDDFRPMQLNNFGKTSREDQTNFLTFNKPVPSYEAVEYMHGGSNGPDWAAQLDDTFAKKGVYQFRYGDIANPVAAGVDYNIDMGGNDIFKLQPSPEKMEAGKKFMGMPIKKEHAAVASYVKESAQYKPPVTKPMSYKAAGKLNSYEEYGYKEMGLKEKQGGGEMAMFLRSPEHETAIFKQDSGVCSPGSTFVHGHCIPREAREGPICPPGWHINKDGRCQLDKDKEFAHGSTESASSSPCSTSPSSSPMSASPTLFPK